VKQKYCIDCGKEIKGFYAVRCHNCANFIITRKFIGSKHTEEHKLKLKKSWNYEKHITPEWREKQRKIHIGIPVVPIGSKWSPSFKEKMLVIRKKQWTNEVREKLSNSLSREKGSNWKGGITSLLMNIRHCYKYKKWIKNVFERDNYICQECGKRGGNLEAHHIKQFCVILSENNINDIKSAKKCNELWDIKNGKTLCIKCHRKVKHNLFRKSILIDKS
jgi:hypothetical protein